MLSLTILGLAALLLIGFAACKKNDSSANKTVKLLYLAYHDGTISECKYEGRLVYCAGSNAYDGGSTIYDASGKQIGSCSYAWGTPDSMCFRLTDCKVIYRSAPNLQNLPPVDVYGLAD